MRTATKWGGVVRQALSEGVRDRVLLMAFIVALLVVFCGPFFAYGRDGRVDKYNDGLRVSTSGTKVGLLAYGAADIANGTTSKAVTVTGVAVGDYAFATLAENPSSATKSWAIATTNTVTVYVDQDPGTTMTVNWQVLGP